MENQGKQRSSFSNSLGFVLAAAGSAVGLGNIWRFPYLAAKDGGGLFLLVYVVLALTFGFALLIMGVNYLIFKERLLGEVASTAEKYVNQAVSLHENY